MASRAKRTQSQEASDQTAQAQQGGVEEQDATAEDLVAQDPHDVLEGRSPQEAVASSLGAPNDYPYLDKTALPVHERNFSNMNADFGPSQSDLNPAFTAKPDEGGPSKERDGEQVIEGTEPNAQEKALAAAENSGQEGAVEAVQADIDAGKDQQMDVDAVNAAADERTPDNVDASTGQKEG